MELRSVDFTQGAVLVLGGKGKKERALSRALSLRDADETSGNVTLKLLADWIDMRQSVRGAARTNRLWVSMKGTPLNRESLRRILLRICHDAGIDGNRPPHSFRRSWFTESYQASPTSIRVLASRMGWSDKSHHMIDVYTRGANVDLARTTPVPSLSARWHAGAPTPPLRPMPTRAPAAPAPSARPATRPAASAEALQAMLEAITTDPARAAAGAARRGVMWSSDSTGRRRGRQLVPNNEGLTRHRAAHVEVDYRRGAMNVQAWPVVFVFDLAPATGMQPQGPQSCEGKAYGVAGRCYESSSRLFRGNSGWLVPGLRAPRV